MGLRVAHGWSDHRQPEVADGVQKGYDTASQAELFLTLRRTIRAARLQLTLDEQLGCESR